MQAIKQNNLDQILDIQIIEALKSVLKIENIPDKISTVNNARPQPSREALLQLFIYGSFLNWQSYIALEARTFDPNINSIMYAIYAYTEDANNKIPTNFYESEKIVYEYIRNNITPALQEFNKKKSSFLKNSVAQKSTEIVS